MIRALRGRQDEPTQFDLPAEAVGDALQDKDNLIWLDFGGEPDTACEPILRDVFKFHPLAIDDALRESHVPKIDDWGNYLYLVVHSVVYEAEADEPLDTRELDLFVGPNYIVSHHEQVIPAIEGTWERCQRDERLLRRGPGYLLYELLDTQVGAIFPLVDEMDEALERVEDEIFDNGGPEILHTIFSLKRSLLELRRLIAPQREVVNKLARDDFSVLKREDRVYFRDVYDHLVRGFDISESMRDQATGALETYLSVINNRMNDVMKTLTIITTMFMPLSVLVGFFGMNFFEPSLRMPAWTGHTALIVALLVMLGSPLGMFLWARRRGWV